jgi:hypothetical protein
MPRHTLTFQYRGGGGNMGICSSCFESEENVEKTLLYSSVVLVEVEAAAEVSSSVIVRFRVDVVVVVGVGL